MIVLATDFGMEGPYTGQMKAVITAGFPEVSVVDLFSNLPSGDPRLSSYLIAAYTTYFSKGNIFICVVDPGVGSSRRALCLDIDGNWFIGPDNGLFEIVIRRQQAPLKTYEIIWRPEVCSASFHGRDIFAPIAVRLARGDIFADEQNLKVIEQESIRYSDWPDDLHEIIYIDHYGNAITGLRASTLSSAEWLEFGQYKAPRGKTFSSVLPGQVVCYENSNGLIEIAINQGRADQELGLSIGDHVTPVLE